MKVQLDFVAEILEYDVYNCIIEELNERKGKNNRKYVELGDVREIIGDAAYRKLVLKRLNFC
jgi:hypothetical protein